MLAQLDPEPGQRGSGPARAPKREPGRELAARDQHNRQLWVGLGQLAGRFDAGQAGADDSQPSPGRRNRRELPRTGALADGSSSV